MQKSAHLYHYKMQKERLVAVEDADKRGGRAGQTDRSDRGSTADSEVEEGTLRARGVAGNEGDTVYEYPGLATGANMEIINPVYRGPQMSPLASQSISGQIPQQTGSGQNVGGAQLRPAPARPP